MSDPTAPGPVSAPGPTSAPGPAEPPPAFAPPDAPGMGETVVARARRPAAFRPLVRLIAGGLLGRRRTAGVALLSAAPVLVAAILAFAGGLGDAETLAGEVYAAITLGLVIPLVALLLGTAALGTAFDDGTILYLLLKPVPRRTVLLAAMVVAGVAAALLALASTLVAGLLLLGASAPALLAGMLAATLLAAVLYAAVFVTLSVFTGRALLLGLGYVLVWEGLVTSLLEGTRILSIREYALAFLGALSGDPSATPGGGVDPLVAMVLSAAVLVIAISLGTWRLTRFEVTQAG